MARPIKLLQAGTRRYGQLRRRSRSTTIGVRDRERANIILLRIQGLRVESSWLNLVERFFADLTGDVIRAGWEKPPCRAPPSACAGRYAPLLQEKLDSTTFAIVQCKRFG